MHEPFFPHRFAESHAQAPGKGQYDKLSLRGSGEREGGVEIP